MPVERSLKLLEIYTKCPLCGNEMLGNGEGTLTIEENKFERLCKCGFYVKIEEGKRKDKK